MPNFCGNCNAFEDTYCRTCIEDYFVSPIARENSVLRERVELLEVPVEVDGPTLRKENKRLVEDNNRLRDQVSRLKMEGIDNE